MNNRSSQLKRQDRNVKLAMLAQQGDVNARNQIIEENQPGIKAIAQRWKDKTNAHELSDLCQEGSIALLTAIDRFDPSKGEWNVYAKYWIEHGIRRAIQTDGRLIKLPVAHETAITRIETAYNKLTLKLGRVPTEDEVAADTDYDVTHIREIMSWQDARHLEDMNVEPESPENNEDDLPDVLNILDEDEHSVFTYVAIDGHSIHETSRFLGMGRLRVEKLLASATEKLRFEIEMQRAMP